MSDATFTRRAGGVLLHPTSLPGPFGIGDLGPAALAWIDALAAAGLSFWQVLPLGPTGYGDSPYQSPSSFAGNLNLLSPERLAEDNLVSASGLVQDELPDGPVDYDTVVVHKRRLAEDAWHRFRAGDAPGLRAPFDDFVRRNAAWLDDYAVFMALKEMHGGAPWWQWPLARHGQAAIVSMGATLEDQIGVHRFGQFLFFRQWDAVRRHAARKGVRLIGDLPIYVAQDSVDVWAHPELFHLDEAHQPTVVAGVPPDYFSATGQLWGNPIYAWQVHHDSGYVWWAERLRAALRQVDVIRLDHFRGLEAYWAVPAGDETAQRGTWNRGPGGDLLRALDRALGGLPIIAEDLGFITPEVEELRTTFNLPGMCILQFAFGGAVEERFLPHEHDKDLVVYTGTHDNDTTAGWYAGLTPEEREDFHAYAPGATERPVAELIRLAWASVGRLAVVPYQDVLGLGSEARMNRPGTATGNWRWRMTDEMLGEERLELLVRLGAVYRRGAGKKD